jgi:hypothetical protein
LIAVLGVNSTGVGGVDLARGVEVDDEEAARETRLRVLVECGFIGVDVRGEETVGVEGGGLSSVCFDELACALGSVRGLRAIPPSQGLKLDQRKELECVEYPIKDSKPLSFPLIPGLRSLISYPLYVSVNRASFCFLGQRRCSR